MVGAAATTHGTWGEYDASLADRLTQSTAAAEKTREEIGSTRARLLAMQATLRTSQAIADPPDWSLLMALIANKAGAEVVLKSLVAQAKAPEPAAHAKEADRPKAPGKAAAAHVDHSPSADPGWGVALAGVGINQAAVSRFVLRLEATGLFRQVKLLETSREAFAGREAVGFRVECALGDGAAPAPRPTEGRASAVVSTRPMSAGLDRGNARPSTRPVDGRTKPTAIAPVERATIRDVIAPARRHTPDSAPTAALDGSGG